MHELSNIDSAHTARVPAWLGPLAFALTTMQDDHAWCHLIRFNLGEGRERPFGTSTPFTQVQSATRRLCRLFADETAPVGARSCAAVVLDDYARHLIDEDLRNKIVDAQGWGVDLLRRLDGSGATNEYMALQDEMDQAHTLIQKRRRRRGTRGKQRLHVMRVSRFHLLNAACDLAVFIEDWLRPVVEETQLYDSRSSEESDASTDDEGSPVLA